MFTEIKMVPKGGFEFETSLRDTRNFIKKNKKSFSGTKKTSKKISLAETQESKEIKKLNHGGDHQKVCVNILKI